MSNKRQLGRNRDSVNKRDKMYNKNLTKPVKICLPNPYLYMLNTESSENMDPALAKLTKNDLNAVECSPGETV